MQAIPDWALALGLIVLTAATHMASAALVRRALSGQGRLADSLQKRLGLPEGQRLLELRWLHWSLMCLVWFTSVWLILRLLGQDLWAKDWLLKATEAGFTLAGIHIVPARILLGVILIVLLVSVSRYLRSVLEKRLHQQYKMDSATSESLATLGGYLGFIFAMLAGLSVAGFNFTNLAIVAGALSVGIGFGLQNIVNNFISGLILLTERPVRRGDYVKVGEVEGEVRKIHIRATEIETLDRVSVVVPNSELISSPVHNWRLRDPYIRVVILVGVAYGSDVKKVKQLLEEIGLAHELTLPRGTPGVPDTHALFIGFGDSSLNFELRTFIRDVSKRAVVASDLRFEIDKAFREHKVEIPFPQRVVWMRQESNDD